MLALDLGARSGGVFFWGWDSGWLVGSRGWDRGFGEGGFGGAVVLLVGAEARPWGLGEELGRGSAGRAVAGGCGVGGRGGGGCAGRAWFC